MAVVQDAASFFVPSRHGLPDQNFMAHEAGLGKRRDDMVLNTGINAMDYNQDRKITGSRDGKR
ncbi:hypothetical protein ACM0P6_02405 [Komagataeibacter sucrofermentans]|nr:hypothetical protein [Komagataeibacter sucrofermentans]